MKKRVGQKMVTYNGRAKPAKLKWGCFDKA